MKRLFFALWPENEIRERIYAISRMLPKKCGRRVAKDKLHITLVFLGTINEQQCQDVQQAASKIRSQPFSLDLDKAGKWSGSKVIWLAPSTTPEVLNSLVAELNKSAIKCGIQIENRSYKPHVTLARKARGPVTYLDIEPFQWKIESFSLVQSETMPEGAQYEVIQSWPLG
jgi:2'-5' RNA ligase